MAAVTVIIIAFVLTVALMLIFGTFFAVEQQTAAPIERFHKYLRTAQPGLNFKVPFIDRVAATVSLKVQQLVVKVETKTKDNVFVRLDVAVQYRVTKGQEASSFYQLANHEQQITSFTLDIVRSQVPTLTLDETFEKKDDIGNAVKAKLAEAIGRYGYEFLDAPVTDVDPAQTVKAAMNEIQTQTRLQVAAQAKGEANKVLAVKNAEAEKETKRLQGEGIAAERIAIATGIKTAVDQITSAGVADPSEGMKILLLTQYFDTLKAIGASGKSSTVFLQHSPGGMADLFKQISEAVMVGNQI